MPAMIMPARFTPSCSSEAPTSVQWASGTATAMFPAAGTVVTEMKTPTSEDDFPAVSDRIPATPLSCSWG